MALRPPQCNASRKGARTTMAKLHKTEKWTFSLTVVVALTAATLFGGFYGDSLFGATPANAELTKRMKEYTDLLNAVSAWSPDDTGSDKFVYASIDGMLRALDPHTSRSEEHTSELQS